MIPIWLIKFAGNRIYKAIKHNRELKKIEEYVNKPNELDIQIKELRNEQAVSNKYLDICNDKIKKLQRDSHPPQEYICCRKCGCKIAKVKINKRRK